MPAPKPKQLQEEPIELKTAEIGKVYYEKSVTKNMGDFNSARVTVGIELPIEHTENDVTNVRVTIKLLDKMVTKELERQIEELIS